MSLDQDFVLKALLQHNFLPNHDWQKEELPPVLSSLSFSKTAAENLIQSQKSRTGAYQGYDTVQYKLTRFNSVSRSLSIPHPRAYANLSLQICENWDNLRYVSENPISQFRPKKHKDGRITIMNYENSLRNSVDALRSSFGKRFEVHADISNCYPSFYSHSIPWAIVGFDNAKRDRTQRKWYNKLDAALRLTKRGETNGLAIGPATSDIVAETVLARIDEKLHEEFEYIRFIDDYVAYFEREEEARAFILRLEKELAVYKLTLNIGKTSILPLPYTLVTGWVTELAAALPEGKVSSNDAVNYLHLAVRLSRQSPDGSVLKYALRSLLRQTLGPESIRNVLQYGLNLSFHQPVLIPMLEKLFDQLSPLERVRHFAEIQQLTGENIKYGRSDAISWLLYLSNKYRIPIEKDCADQIIRSRDCIPMLLLYLSGGKLFQQKVISFAGKLDKKYPYELDQYWLLLYQLFLDRRIRNPYRALGDRSFEIMKAEGVTFVEP